MVCTLGDDMAVCEDKAAQDIYDEPTGVARAGGLRFESARPEVASSVCVCWGGRGGGGGWGSHELISWVYIIWV